MALTTKQVALQSGVSPRLVRHYLNRGLIQSLGSEGRGHSYSAVASLRMQFIRNGLDTGFTLREIARILSLGETSNRKDKQKIAGEALEAIERRMATLDAMQASIRASLQHSSSSGNRKPLRVASAGS